MVVGPGLPGAGQVKHSPWASVGELTMEAQTEAQLVPRQAANQISLNGSCFNDNVGMFPAPGIAKDQVDLHE